jgi:hypothetical protein
MLDTTMARMAAKKRTRKGISWTPWSGRSRSATSMAFAPA